MEEKKKKAELPKAVAKKEKEGNLSASEPPPKAEAKKGTNLILRQYVGTPNTR
jgi:hypothetical protein